MQYKAQLAPIGPEIIKVALGRQTNVDVGEFIRKQFIHGMRQGETLCFDTETTTPDWAAYNSEGTFVAEQFFNWEFFNQEANHMPYVREDENHGIGGINPGFGYCRAATFGMVIRCGVETEEELTAITSKIPLFNEQFQHVVIQ